MILDELPYGWATASIRDAMDWNSVISDGDWVESKDQDPTGNIRLIQLADIGDGVFNNKSKRFMNKDDAGRLNCTFLQKGDVLIARMPDPLGRACIFPRVGQEAVTVVDICLVRCSAGSALSNHILQYWINSPIIRSSIALQASGTTRKRITRKKLEVLGLPLPPLAEQKQIAAKLDELLAQVDSIKTRLDAIPAILKRFRQSVLAAAVSGRLTEEWRGVHNAKNWEEKVIDDLVKVVNGKAFQSKGYQESGVRLLRPGNLHASGRVVWNKKNTTHIPLNWMGKRPELLLKNGALLMNLTAQSLKDEFLGRVCILEDEGDVLLNQRICSFLSKLDYDIKPFLYIYFKSPVFREYVSTLDSGSLIKHLNVKDVKAHTLLLPSKLEQTEIVRRVEQLFAFADQIEQRLTDAQFHVNHLTQSILAKAFRGELTAEWRAQHPELISGKHSAQALLKRIEAQRRSAPAKRRTRKKSQT